MGGKRLAALERILGSDEPTRQYREELHRAFTENITRDRMRQGEELAEAAFRKYKNSILKEEFDNLIKEYSGKKTSTPRPKISTRFDLPTQWTEGEDQWSGKHVAVDPPSVFAHTILTGKAGDNTRNTLAGIVAQLGEEVEAATKKRAIAEALLAAAEDTRTVEKKTWTKIPAINAGALPRSPNNLKYENGRWPPESDSEKKRAAEIWPSYAQYLGMKEVITGELPEDYQGMYRQSDKLRAKHDALIREWRDRAAMKDPKVGWELSIDKFDQAWERAESEVM